MHQVGEILFFHQYVFTDNGDRAAHFGLVLCPQYFTYTNSVHTCVIKTTKPETKLRLLLRKENYSCLKHDSYACFNRLDGQPLESYQKRGELSAEDIKKGYEILKKCIKFHPHYVDPFIRATFIKEWKKKISNNS